LNNVLLRGEMVMSVSYTCITQLTGRFVQDDSRNSMDVSRKQASMLFHSN